MALTDNMTADQKQEPAPAGQNYKGFVAGVFSGVAKLTGTSSLSLYLSLSYEQIVEQILALRFSLE